jgi:kynureninase
MEAAMAELDVASLRTEYSAFLRPGRLLLTGHSHQAWPDCARDAQAAYFDDAARFVDDKWGKAIFPKMESVASRLLARMGFPKDDPLAFGKSSHELVFRLLSCLRWADRPRIVTTTSEFHSLHRQLSRLAEESAEIVWVDGADRATLCERLVAAIDERTALVAVSAVMFEDAFVLPELAAVVTRAVEVGAIPLIDAYHAFNVVPLSLGPQAHHAFVVAGGYKYAQFGEGVCWMRVPRGCQLRPAYTGWFADFEGLERPRAYGPVGYGSAGERFSGATFDASAIYRAAAVLDHFDRFDLGVAALRARSLQQTGRLIAALDDRGLVGRRLDLRSPREDARRGGFVSVSVPDAHRIVEGLRARGVLVDARGDILRLGPAPYLLDDELLAGVEALDEVIAGLPLAAR